MEKKKLLIVEDDESTMDQMRWALSEEYDIILADSAEKAVHAVAVERPHVVTLDLGLPPMPESVEVGLRLLGRILQHDPVVKVIVVTGNTDRSPALKAISEGALDFFTKPVDLDELRMILKRAFYIYSLEEEQRRLKRRSDSDGFADITGSSPAMQEVFSIIRKVSTIDVPVLVCGESGTGKELAARAIHSNSLRRSRPFIAINCGAIPENLLESELFGHEKGSFTGAHTQRAGRIELANGGTLFLDEIGELPLALQVKMLRFLQDHKIERVGGRGPISIDVRVIAATNRNLRKMIQEEQFREDLYYRLAVVTLDLPPLRDRGDDIILLAKSFLNRFASGRSRPARLGEDAIEAIRTFSWPGNVRELENRIRRAITFADGSVIGTSDLGFTASEDSDFRLDLKRAKEELEARYVNMAILKHGGNISRAARELGLSRPTIHQILKRNNINAKAREA